jgi:hypothetical protein
MAEPLLLSPGDFFCSYSPTWVGALIRIGSRSLGEERTKVNHTGVVAAAGTLDSAVIVEALSKVMAHTVAEHTRDQRPGWRSSGSPTSPPSRRSVVS